jgi:hypothetical protein
VDEQKAEKPVYIGIDGEPVAVGDFVEVIDPRTGEPCESGAVWWINEQGISHVNFVGAGRPRPGMMSFDRPRDYIQIHHRYLRAVQPNRTPVPDVFR